MFDRLIDCGLERLTISCRYLITAFDILVRWLLSYIDTYTAAAKNLERFAKPLVLCVWACLRVTRRAIEHFGLLIATEQRHRLSGQTYNRYLINRDYVDAPFCDDDCESASIEYPQQAAALKNRARRNPILLSAVYFSLAHTSQFNFEPGDLSDQAPATVDQPPFESLPTSLFSAVHSLFSLIVALDDRLTR